jgi:hypothetical protein
LVILGLMAVSLVVATCKGDAGAAGVAGPTGATGADGAAGPSATAQNRSDANTAISLVCATPTVITTLTITGPAVYLISASGYVFSSGATPSQVLLAANIFRDAVQLAHGEVGASLNATGHLPGSYAWARLVSVTGATSTIQVRGCRQSGDGTPTVFSNSLTATLVGSGTGPQLAPAIVAEGTR